MNEKVEKLVNQFTLRYIEALSELKNRGQRSYGFEYEFLPDREITAEDVQAVADLLEKKRMSHRQRYVLWGQGHGDSL